MVSFLIRDDEERWGEEKGERIVHAKNEVSTKKTDFHSRKNIKERRTKKDIQFFFFFFCLLNKNQFLLDMTDNKV